MDKNIMKNNYFIFLLSFLIEFFLNLILNYYKISSVYFIPDISLAPVIGLLFGPVGGLGVALGTIIGDFSSGFTLTASLIDGLILFFISVISYKLWYSIMTKHGVNYPCIDSVYNLGKYIIISVIVSVIFNTMLTTATLTFSDVMIDFYSAAGTFMGIISYTVNLFDFMIIYGIIGIILINVYNIPVTKKFNFRSIIPKLNKWIFIGFLGFIVLYELILIHLINYPLINQVIFISYILLALVYILNPTEYNIENSEKSVNFPIMEKLILAFLLLSLVVFISVLVSVILDNHDITLVLTESYRFRVMLEMNVLFILFFLISMIHLEYMEKNISNPLNELIDININDKIPTIEELTDSFSKYRLNNDDISVLIDSYSKMIKDIKNYFNDLKEVTREKERYETEFKIASNIQANMLPINFKEFSKSKNLEIYASMKPAREVGGDFYDFFEIDEENIGFTIGDVSGKGVSAALFMVKTMTLIRNHIQDSSSLSKAFMNINNMLCKRNNEELFVTNWLGKLNTSTGELSFVNAGHNQPLIKEEDSFHYLDTKPGLVLAGMEDMIYKENTIKLKPGNIVFLYTDGVTEANNNYQGFYGEKHLERILNENKNKSMKTIIDKINEDIANFCDNSELFDDTTMLIIKYNG